MSIATLYCDSCGTANRPQARFCYACGESLSNLLSLPQASDWAALMQGLGSNPGLSDPMRFHSLLKMRYRIISQAGQGGMGAVYKAEDSEFGNRLVAVKAMRQDELSASPPKLIEAINAFKREALLLAGLMHPNLPRIYDHFCEGGQWYLVMDFIEGETLETHLYKTPVQHMPVDEVIEIGLQLCATLEYLHTRQPVIIFRDLKPANVMLTPHGHLYLIDFGIARHFKTGHTKDTLVFGSVGYAAPEQYGNAQTTPRSDIYSLGATLYQLLSGNNPAQMPFRFSPLPTQNQSSLVRLNTLVMQMVELDAGKRPASVAVVRQELHSIMAQRMNEQTNTLHLLLPQSGASSALAATSDDLTQLLDERPMSRRTGGAISLPSPHVKIDFPPLGTLLFSYPDHAKRVLGVAWSPDGAYIASAGDDKTVRVWFAINGDTVIIYRGHSAWVKAAVWSPDGRRIASAGADGVVQVWDAFTGRNCFIYRGHTNVVASVAWSPDGMYIASGGYDKTLQVWHATDGDQVFVDHTHNGIVNAVAWSPDGAYIASACDDKMVQVVQVRDSDIHMRHKPFVRRTIFTYTGHTGGVKAVAWSPNGTRLASGSWDNTVHVWDALTGNYIFIHRDHSSWVNAVAWSPAGTRIASASNDKTVQVWDANTGREFFTPRNFFTYYGHTTWVRDVAWASDGERIASASHDQTIQVWQAV